MILSLAPSTKYLSTEHLFFENYPKGIHLLLDGILRQVYSIFILVKNSTEENLLNCPFKLDLLTFLFLFCKNT